jgi:hypothetical protein
MRLLLALLIVTSCTSCQQPTVNHPQQHHAEAAALGTFQFDSQFEGVDYTFTVPGLALTGAPQWKAGADALPLLPEQAEASAIAEAHRLRPDVRKWQCHTLALQWLERDYWIYLVTLARADLPSAGRPDFLRVPVLLSGAAVHPAEHQTPQFSQPPAAPQP